VLFSYKRRNTHREGPGVRLQKATTMYREGKTRGTKGNRPKRDQSVGFASVSDVQIYRVTDLRADFNWSPGSIALGNEDEKVTRAVGLLLRRLQDRYELID
jgi:hypothetical protein